MLTEIQISVGGISVLAAVEYWYFESNSYLLTGSTFKSGYFETREELNYI